MVGFFRAFAAASAVPAAAAAAYALSSTSAPSASKLRFPLPASFLSASSSSSSSTSGRAPNAVPPMATTAAAAADLSAPDKQQLDSALPELTTLGDLGTLEAGENGEAHFSGRKEKLRVVDLIGRSIALYAAEDKSDPGIAAAVIARSAGVGENYKKLCTCDGVTIWESS